VFDIPHVCTVQEIVTTWQQTLLCKSVCYLEHGLDDGLTAGRLHKCQIFALRPHAFRAEVDGTVISLRWWALQFKAGYHIPHLRHRISTARPRWGTSCSDINRGVSVPGSPYTLIPSLAFLFYSLLVHEFISQLEKVHPVDL